MLIDDPLHRECSPLRYGEKLLEYVRDNLLALKFGKKYKLLTIGRETVIFYTLSETQNTIIPMNVKIQKYGSYIDLRDYVEIKSCAPLIDHATDILGDQARITLDTIAMNELTSGNNVLYAGGVDARSQLTGEQKLTKMDIRKAVSLLQRENIPTFEDGYYVCLIHPDKLLDLFTDQELFMLSAYNTSASEKGMVGRFAGVKFYVTPTLPTVVGGNGSTVYQTLVIGKDAYGIVDLDSATLEMRYEDIDDRGRVKRIGWVAYFAVKRLNEKAIVRIESN